MSWRFETDCVSCPGDDAGAVIGAMVDEATEISRRTFLRYVEPDNLRALERALNYEAHPRRGLTMAGDWAVSYFRSTFRGRPCVYFVWSAIEHVFTAAGDGDAWCTAYGAQRGGRRVAL
jgi:hypothetical protein